MEFESNTTTRRPVTGLKHSHDVEIGADSKSDDASGKSPNQRISVYGLGYVGLPVAGVLASRGFEILGVDVTSEIVETINSGKVHIVEPDLDMVVQAAVSAGKLRASLEPEQADVFIIAVPTPFIEGQAARYFLYSRGDQGDRATAP